MKQKNDIAQVVAKIKEPITTLANYFRIKDSHDHQPTPKYGHKNFRLGMVNTIISFVIVILLAFHIILSPKGNSTDGSKKEYTELKKQYDELSRNYDKLLSDYNSLLNINSNQKEEEEQKAAEAKKKAEEERKAAEAKKKAEEEKKAANAVTSSFTISITPNETDVEVGKQYTFTIKGYDGNGKWAFDGFEPEKGKITDISIVVKAKKSTNGNVAKVTYTPENGMAKSKSFKYKE